ncbi:MAG: hypothetical protein KAS47_03825 [Candidatus Heimdallarchaeota archaeon]|nr:hypothetical protein [Candidatus Heimdallarchaeota archaeon]
MTTLHDYIGENEKKLEEESKREAELHNELLEQIQRKQKQEVNFTGFDGKLSELVDGIRTIPNYNNLKGYIREKILPKHPNINYKKLSVIAGLHQGVALVIMYDLYNDKLEAEFNDLEDPSLDYHYQD